LPKLVDIIRLCSLDQSHMLRPIDYISACIFRSLIHWKGL